MHYHKLYSLTSIPRNLYVSKGSYSTRLREVEDDVYDFSLRRKRHSHQDLSTEQYGVNGEELKKNKNRTKQVLL